MSFEEEKDKVWDEMRKLAKSLDEIMPDRVLLERLMTLVTDDNDCGSLLTKVNGPQVKALVEFSKFVNLIVMDRLDSNVLASFCLGFQIGHDYSWKYGSLRVPKEEFTGSLE